MTEVDLTAELPTERAIVRFEKIPIPLATESTIAFSAQVAELGQQLEIDLPGTMHYLVHRAGMAAVEAAAIHIDFTSPDEFRARNRTPDLVLGVHQSRYVEAVADDSNPSGLLSYKHYIGIPLTETSLQPQGLAELNGTLRHELGHAVCGGRFGENRLYDHLLSRKPSRGPEWQNFTAPEIVPNLKVFRFLPVRAVERLAIACGINPLLALHLLDKEERFARRFDRKHAKALNPIALSGQ